jgi:hypothetical protein
VAPLCCGQPVPTYPMRMRPPLFLSSGAVTAFAAVTLWQFLDFYKVSIFDLLNHELSDSVTNFYREVFIGCVVKIYCNLAAISGVDSARGIQHSYAVLVSKAGPWVN